MSDFFDSLINDPLFKRMEQMSLLNEGEEAKGDSYTLVEEKEYENGELVNSYKRTRKVKDGKVIEDTLEKEPKLENKCTEESKESCCLCNKEEAEEKCTCNKEDELIKPVAGKRSPNYDEILKYKKDICELKMEIEALRLKNENYKIAQEEDKKKIEELRKQLGDVYRKSPDWIEKNMKPSVDFFKYFTKWLNEINPNDSFFTATVPFSDREYRKNRIKDSRIKDIFNGNKDGNLDLNRKIVKDYNSNREDKLEKIITLIKELL